MEPVLIYRNELLPLSETFIRQQAAALTRFNPVFVGLLKCEKGLPLQTSVILSQDSSFASRLRGLVYKATGYAPSFYAQAKRVGAKLLHAHFAMDGANALPLAKSLQVPMIVTLHGNDVTASDYRHWLAVRGQIYRATRKKMWRNAPLFLCDSDFLRRKAIEIGFPEEKLRVHYIGIDLAYFQPLELPTARNSVLFVARLVEKKGCSYLIRAMQDVQNRFPDAQLMVIGDGPERPSLESQARAVGIKYEFRGAQPSSVIRQALGAARVFCVPSVTAKSGDSEGLGIVFAEAQAMGVPVVSFAHGGIPEVVCHGSTGLLAPERDHQMLAQHILRFLADEEFWRDCSRRASVWISKQFDLRKQTSQLETLYEKVIAEGRPTVT
jgi:colanic acid/amylovoran biosynthesis glycosyltransferase